MKRKNFPHRRKQRRAEAEERNEARNRRSAAEQLTLVRQRPGGSVRERERLIAQIEAAQVKKNKKKGAKNA